MDVHRLRSKWSNCVANPRCASDPACRRRAESAAREIMRRSRENVVTIVERLSAMGYRFVDPEPAYVPPSPTIADEISQFESHGLHVPLALRVWYEEVGEVNLMG